MLAHAVTAVLILLTSFHLVLQKKGVIRLNI